MKVDPLQYVMEERARQDEKWGVQTHDNLYWLGILMEEVGETAKAIIEHKQDKVYKELVQVVAVGLAWLEDLEAERNPHTSPTGAERK